MDCLGHNVISPPKKKLYLIVEKFGFSASFKRESSSVGGDRGHVIFQDLVALNKLENGGFGFRIQIILIFVFGSVDVE